MNSQKNQQYLIRKAAKLARDLAEILDELAASQEEKPPQQTKPKGDTFDEKELQADYDKLRETATQSDQIETEVSQFIDASTKERLRAFVAANNLPIDGNASKQVVGSQLTRLLRQSKAISAPVSSLSKIGKQIS